MASLRVYRSAVGLAERIDTVVFEVLVREETSTGTMRHDAEWKRKRVMEVT